MLVGSDYSRDMNIVVNHLASSTSCAFIFLNSRSLVDNLTKSLETRIDKHHSLDADVVEITGAMQKPLKYTNINLFTQKIRIPGMDPRVMVATSAGDLGIDHPDAQLVYNCEFPEDVSTLVQRRGRASRHGEPAKFIVKGGLASYLNLTRRISDVTTDYTNNDDAGEVAGFNNAEIATPKTRFAGATSKDNIEAKYALSKHTITQLQLEQTNDFLSVLSLLCFNLGCQHGRLESFCATGEMRAGSMDNNCGDACSICTGDYQTLFKPLCRAGVTMFLEREDGLRGPASVGTLVSLVWKNPFWTTTIFDVKMYKTAKYHIEAMFLQLIAAQFLVAVAVDGELHWKIGQENTTAQYPPFRYRATKNWAGVHLLPEDHVREHALS